MTMQIIKENLGKYPTITKMMGEMKRGEVCWVTAGDDYVICVQHASFPKIYLALKSYGTAQTYGGAEHVNLEVRELYEGESVTIKFS